ncbi:hypothetical protein [Haloferula sp.]|uniref:hypothetical protein n=1 Tax=Haloferula sp. TaxID=2497595 RepID=UPI00329C3B3E
MSDDKGIFEPKEGFASEPPPRSPFAVDETADSPFASAPEGKSPFAVDDSEATRLKPEATKLPEKRSEPFASGENKSPFGYEPPVAGFGGSPFEGSPSPSPSAAKDSPFAVDESTKEEPAKETPVAASPFSEAKAGPSDAVAAAVAAAAGSPVTPAASTPPPISNTPEPVPASTPAKSTPAASTPSSPVGESDSSSIRQLELRAIFGVDRELSEAEILQRSRALPGIRHLGRIANADIGMIDGIKKVLSNLDFGGGEIQLQCNNAPIDFVREGSVLLAVQTDGSFAPGVRETLMIVARELGRM